MSLGHAILGFLHEHPRTGYTLKKEQFDGSVAHIWPAQLPQIYRELERMEEMGWITRETSRKASPTVACAASRRQAWRSYASGS